MAVDVVVVNFHTDDLLQDFIESYKRVRFDECTLTVVDVESQGEPYRTGSIDVGWKMWITEPSNCGYGNACNRGASVGVNDVILLANADTVLSDGFKECYDALMAHDDWGVLGPRQVNERGQITAGGIFGIPQAPAQRGWNEYDHGQCSDVRDDALSVSGSLYFVKRSVWKELTYCSVTQMYHPGVLGAFLETPHYFEEMTSSVHARGHGYKCVYYGPVVMTHYWHQASVHGGWADRQFATSQAMHRQFCALHGLPCE